MFSPYTKLKVRKIELWIGICITCCVKEKLRPTF